MGSLIKTSEDIIYKFAKVNKLTRKETQIIKLMCCGENNVYELAECLGITLNTLNNHFTNIFKKQGVTSKVELLANVIKYLLNSGDSI